MNDNMNRLQYIIRIIFAGHLLFLPVVVSETAVFGSYYIHTDYFIVIDAGITETNIFLYQFETSFTHGLEIKTAYTDTAPAISFYGDDPKEYIQILKKRIMVAKGNIPIAEWSKTPLTLIANLKYLSVKSADKMLTEIRTYFSNTGLKIEEDSVSQMGGRMKLFTWLTVNWLLGNFETRGSKTVTTLGMGTYASQVVFHPESEHQLSKWQYGFLTNMTVFDKEHKVFAYSYVGLGLNEARRQILELNKDLLHNKYVSPCLHPSVNTTWSYNGREYAIEGAPVNATTVRVDVKACKNAIKTIVAPFKRSPVPLGNEVYALMHYYRVVVNAGLTKKNESLVISLGALKEKVKELCAIYKPDQPFLCMDLMYIRVVLRKLYRIHRETEINFVTKLKGNDVRWTLGVALEKYQKLPVLV